MLWCSLAELDLVIFWEKDAYELMSKLGVGIFRQLMKNIISDISKIYIKGNKFRW